MAKEPLWNSDIDPLKTMNGMDPLKMARQKDAIEQHPALDTTTTPTGPAEVVGDGNFMGEERARKKEGRTFHSAKGDMNHRGDQPHVCIAGGLKKRHHRRTTLIKKKI